ncbi:MAG: hypothetical protein FJY67_02565 [Calditrichaeota bacterium]|nr:hypothetical protein [Calditrichota bacterium]
MDRHSNFTFAAMLLLAAITLFTAPGEALAQVEVAVTFDWGPFIEYDVEAEIIVFSGQNEVHREPLPPNTAYTLWTTTITNAEVAPIDAPTNWVITWWVDEVNNYAFISGGNEVPPIEAEWDWEDIEPDWVDYSAGPQR